MGSRKLLILLVLLLGIVTTGCAEFAAMMGDGLRRSGLALLGGVPVESPRIVHAGDIADANRFIWEGDRGTTTWAREKFSGNKAPVSDGVKAITDPIIKTELSEFHFLGDAVIYCLDPKTGHLASVNFIVTIEDKPDWIEEVYTMHPGDGSYGYRSFEGKKAEESVFICEDIEPDPALTSVPKDWSFSSHAQGFIVMGDLVAPGLTWAETLAVLKTEGMPPTYPEDTGVLATAMGLLLNHMKTSHPHESCDHEEAKEMAAHILLLAKAMPE